MAQARGRRTTDPGPRFDQCKEESSCPFAKITRTTSVSPGRDAWCTGITTDLIRDVWLEEND